MKKTSLVILGGMICAGGLLPFDANAVTGTYTGNSYGFGITSSLGNFYKNSLMPNQSFTIGTWNNLTFNDPTNTLFPSYGAVQGHGSIFAGYSTGGNSSYNNILNIEAGRANYAFAGYNDNKGNVLYNTINITGGEVERAYAGYTNKGDAIGNKLNISGGQTNSWTFAGRSNSGDAYDNTLTMTGGTVSYISGGRSATGEVYDNTVNVSGGIIRDDVTGGRSYRTAYIHNNTVNISGGEFLNGANTYITGGYSNQGLLENNRVEISGAPVFSDGVAIYGSTTYSGSVKNNVVSINDSVDLYDNTVAGGHSYTSGNISGNTVYVNDSPETNLGTKIYGGQSDSGTVSGNSVIMSNTFTGTFNGTAAGGYTNSGDVTGNFMLVGAGTYGSDAVLHGGESISGTVSGNNVSVVDGTFQSGSIVAASVNNGNSYDDNTLTINGGTFESGSIIAGTLVYNDAAPSGVNKIVLTGGTFDKSVIGAVDPSGNEVASHYNHTILDVTSPVQIASISNVSQFNLYVRNNDDPTTPMLNADNIDFGSGAKVQALVGSYGDDLSPGDTFNLFEQNGGGTFTGTVDNAFASQGMSLVGELEYIPTTGNLKVLGISASPHARAFPEARLASFSFLNQSDDLMLGQGVASALEATRKFPENKWRSFAALDLGESHYNTDEGSNGDISYGGVSMVVGASKRLPFDNGKMMLAGYFESGYASTDVTNNDDLLGDVSTDGNIAFYGFGMMSRYDMNDGMYVSGILRAGMVYNTFATNDEFNEFDYENHTAYYGAGLAFGRQFEVFNRDGIDLYSRYMWTQLASQDEYFDGQTYNFDAINSQQIRIGAQYNLMPKENVSYVLGVAGQYEFDGKAKSDVNGLAITTPDIKGFTGMVEFGMRLRSLTTPSFTSSLSIEGFLGARDGASATLDFTYSF